MSRIVRKNYFACSCSVGRWWIVYPVSGIFVALSIWLTKQWPPGREQVLLGITAGISVYFTTVIFFSRSPAHFEIRGIGLSLLAFSIGAMSLQGVLLGMGITTYEKTERILNFSFYGCAVGLAWMAVHYTIR